MEIFYDKIDAFMLALYTNMRNKLITMTVKNVYKLSFDQFFFSKTFLMPYV